MILVTRKLVDFAIKKWRENNVHSSKNADF